MPRRSAAAFEPSLYQLAHTLSGHLYDQQKNFTARLAQLARRRCRPLVADPMLGMVERRRKRRGGATWKPEERPRSPTRMFDLTFETVPVLLEDDDGEDSEEDKDGLYLPPGDTVPVVLLPEEEEDDDEVEANNGDKGDSKDEYYEEEYERRKDSVQKEGGIEDKREKGQDDAQVSESKVIDIDEEMKLIDEEDLLDMEWLYVDNPGTDSETGEEWPKFKCPRSLPHRLKTRYREHQPPEKKKKQSYRARRQIRAEGQDHPQAGGGCSTAAPAAGPAETLPPPPPPPAESPPPAPEPGGYLEPYRYYRYTG